MEGNQAAFSILMNCYNGERFLNEAIDSIYSQTFDDWEIIFIDNCSTDRSPAIAKSYDGKLKYHNTGKLISLGEARALGLRSCRGRYLAFLDSDDAWLPEKLEKQYEILENDSETQMVYGGAIWIDEAGKKVGELIPELSDDIFRDNLVRYEINMQTVAIRNGAGIIFNPGKSFSPDFDLFMKIASEQRVALIPEAVVKYRKLPRSLTTEMMDRWWIETGETLDEIFEGQPQLKEKYPYEMKLAYAKVSYYKARALFSQHRYRDARKELAKHFLLNTTYFILYMLSFSRSLWAAAHYARRKMS